MTATQITAANAGQHLVFAGKSRIVSCHRPGVAHLHRSLLFAHAS